MRALLAISALVVGCAQAPDPEPETSTPTPAATASDANSRPWLSPPRTAQHPLPLCRIDHGSRELLGPDTGNRGLGCQFSLDGFTPFRVRNGGSEFALGRGFRRIDQSWIRRCLDRRVFRQIVLAENVNSSAPSKGKRRDKLCSAT